MDFAMEDGYCEIENSGCSSTSTIDNWNDWSPVIDDWAPLAGDTTDIDFHSLIESMMMPASACNFPESTTTSNESSPARIPEHDDSSVGEGVGDDDKGLRLVHMLMAAAEALTGAHKSRELARVILVRLREMVSPPAVIAGAGSNMERLAAHFTDALQGLVDGTRAGGSHHRPPDDRHQSGDVTAAFQLLQDMSPYVKFGHFTANQAIIESVSSDRRVHIVDFDIMEGVQWASLMQALISQKDGPPPPHVRITAITRGGVGVGGGGSGRKPMSSVQETGRRLVSFAASLGLPFSFSQCRLDPDEKFRPSAIKVVKGETLIANCVLHPPHLPHRPASSIASFLTGIATLNAKLVTLVEEEGEIRRKGDEENGFVGQFMDELQRYSAIWDSLEAGFPKQGWARGLVEKVILGPTIASTVQRAYRRLEEKEGERGWGDWMSNTMGFGRVGITFFNHCQARLLLGLFHDGYRVEEVAANKLVLGWKSRRLISASVWSAPPPYLPPSTTTSGFSG